MLYPQALLESIKANPSGGTVPMTGEPPTDGYYVSLPVGGIALSPDFSPHLARNLTAAENLIILCDPGLDSPRMFIGWWLDESGPLGPLILVEPVIHIATQPDALVVARALNQRYIFSVTEQSTIPVKETA